MSPEYTIAITWAIILKEFLKYICLVLCTTLSFSKRGHATVSYKDLSV